MKTLKKPSRFLKLVLPVIFAFFMKPFMAQNDLCNDPCPPGPIQTRIIDLCKFSWAGTVTDPSSGTSWTDNVTDAPFVFVIINYRTRTCNGFTSVIIEDYVYVDNRDYWINQWHAGYLESPSVGPSIAGAGCPYPDPASPVDIKNAIVAAGYQFLVDISFPQSLWEVYFKGACYSMVKLSFPAGSFWAHPPNDLGQRDTTFLTPNTPAYQRIPCNDACCKVNLEQHIITLANGETTYTYRAINYEGDGPGCGIQPLPDYNAFNPKLEATMYDPITKTYVTVTGNVVGQEPCELSCPQFCPQIPSEVAARTFLKTDLSSKEAPLAFSANPTLVNNYIRFTSNKPIVKVLVYDLSGKIILNVQNLDNNELNTSELKNGPYFVTVYFAGNEVKTVKILKQ